LPYIEFAMRTIFYNCICNWKRKPTQY